MSGQFQSRTVEVIGEAFGAAALVALLLFVAWYGALADPAFDPDRAPKAPGNLGRAWVPEEYEVLGR